MTKSINKSLADAIDAALIETGLTMQERVAKAALKTWTDTRVNEPFVISETDAHNLAFNAHKKWAIAKNKRGGKVVEVPTTADYKHKNFTTFDNAVARVKLAVQYAPHLDKAVKIANSLIADDIGSQLSLTLHKAMEAVGEGNAKSWEADKRKSSEDAKDKSAKRIADAITPEGFDKRLKALVDEALELDIVLGPDGKFVVDESEPAKIIEAMPDAAPAVLDNEALAAMMAMPQFQQAVQMAAFAVANTKK